MQTMDEKACPLPPSRQYVIVAQAIRYLQAHARRQPSLRELAQAVHLSEFHLQRVFSLWAGVSPKRFLQFLSKEHALQALRQAADVLTASEAAGLSGPGRLHDLLVSVEAMSPGEIRSGGAGLTVQWGLGETPLGRALLAWTSRGICHLVFIDDAAAAHLAELQARWPAARLVQDDAQAAAWLQRIFPPAPRSGRLHVLLRGTNFQIKVWEALLRLPPGHCVSYSQLAALTGMPRAQRAVGSAVAANTVAYLIPCHRVIRESGAIGQYRWGAERKAALLAWEAARMAAGSSVAG